MNVLAVALSLHPRSPLSAKHLDVGASVAETFTPRMRKAAIMRPIAISAFAPSERPDGLDEALVVDAVLVAIAPIMYVAERAVGVSAEKLSSVGSEQFTWPFISPQHCHLLDVEL